MWQMGQIEKVEVKRQHFQQEKQLNDTWIRVNWGRTKKKVKNRNGRK